MTYYTLGNLKHNGTVYSLGAAVELTEEEAAPLLAAGVLSTENPLDTVPEENAEDDPKADGPEAGGDGSGTTDGPELAEGDTDAGPVEGADTGTNQ